MKLQPLTLPKEKALAELNKFLKFGYILGIVALFIFGFLGVAALAFGARCMMLTYNPNLKSQKNLMNLRLASFGLIVLGLVDTIGYFYVLNK